MFTKGFSLIETLLALVLSCLVLISALSCQWFARRSMQVTLEHMVAMHLLIDISNSVDTKQLPLGQSLTAALSACRHCPPNTIGPLRSAVELLQQLPARSLMAPELCAEQAGHSVRLILSWQSAVAPGAGQTMLCGGTGRRQVMLEVSR